MYAFTQTNLKSKKYFTITFNLWIVIVEDLCILLFIGFEKSKMTLTCNKIRMKYESINILCNYFSGYKHCIRNNNSQKISVNYYSYNNEKNVASHTKKTELHNTLISTK